MTDWLKAVSWAKDQSGPFFNLNLTDVSLLKRMVKQWDNLQLNQMKNMKSFYLEIIGGGEGGGKQAELKKNPYCKQAQCFILSLPWLLKSRK